MLYIQLVNSYYIDTGQVACSTQRLCSCDNEQAFSLFEPATTHLASSGSNFLAFLSPFDILIDTFVGERCYDILCPGECLKLVFKDDRNDSIKHMTAAADEI